MRSRRMVVMGLAAMVAISPAALGYAHFLHYRTRSAPYTGIPEKFDLNALANRTVPYFVAERGPQQMTVGDSFANLISEIRLAARVWSEVEGSDLGLEFGGLIGANVQHNSPAIEVVFEELPPGVLAMGGPSVLGTITESPNGPFVAIQKSTVVLPPTFTAPTWGESFFLTLTHELGHALGLQHSLTSSVMSTQITRGTTKSKPLATDDLVGLCLLYGQRMLAGTGTITGRVRLGTAGVHLASVVALSFDGTAVSALTNPDGTYRIDGIPPGSYYVYAHPLPPAIAGETYNAGIVPPLDADGKLLPASGSFDTSFYPGTRDIKGAQALPVGAGGVVNDVNFTVNRRTAPAVFGVQTFSFPGQLAVKPAHLSPDTSRSYIVAAGYGLTDKAAIAVLGGSASIPQGGVKPYPQDPRYLQVDFQFNLASGEGSRHLSFAADNDLYVLPSAFRITRRAAPQIMSILPSADAAGNRVYTIGGFNLASDTRILFEGVPAMVQRFDESTGSFTVLPPPGYAGQRVSVTALNRDGQSNLFLQGGTPPAVEVESGDAGSFAISPTQIPAGVETMIEVLGTNTGFSPYYARLALGSSGLTVRRMWVVSPTRILANVVAAANTVPGAATVTVVNGLRVVNFPSGLVINSVNPRQSFFRGPVIEGSTGRESVPAGGIGTVRVVGPVTEAAAGSLRVTVADKVAQVLSFNGGLLNFRVPADVAPGPAIVRVTAPSDSPLPIVMAVDPPPPVITAIQVGQTKVDASRPVRAGEIVVLVVSGLAEAGADVDPSRVTIMAGPLYLPVSEIVAVTGGHLVRFQLDPGVPAGNQAVVISIDGRASQPATLPVRAN